MNQAPSTFALAPSGPATGPAASTPSGRDRAREDFSNVLARTSAQPSSPEEQARAAAEQFVSVALIQPLLAQLRGSNQAAPPFAPGPGEKQFQSLFDASIAQQITRARRFPLVDRLTADLLRRSRDEIPAKTTEIKKPPPLQG